MVLNYDAPQERWPAALKASFERYMTEGGGLVSVHAADNAFAGWQRVQRDDRRGRLARAGARTPVPFWFYRDGKLASDTSPGAAGSHGRRTPFQVTVRDATHPIMRGLPPVWMHQGDELYARLRGPGTNMTVLATAFSDPANKGSGRDEPQLMALQYGKGRVFHTTMGHDIVALSSVDFVVTLQRGTEWAATGKVTQKVPASFPTAQTVSYRSDLAAMDPDYPNGLDNLDLPVTLTVRTNDTGATLGRLFSELVDGTVEAGAGHILNTGDVGLLRSLDRLPAAEASRSTNDGAQSRPRAAPALRLSLMNRGRRGRQPFVDAKWDGSGRRAR